uniref:Uncharacterized protein n=1 Tax=uncultured bacterium 126 TaxID=698379 RepID=E3T709_9BACT|nr:hypothetical protein [uncultured bacterium 126]
MQESLATESVRAIASRGDRARRTSAAHGRVARLAPVVAAAACLTSMLSSIMGGPASLGPILLGAGLAVAGATVTAARYRPRALRDDAVAQLDRAAGLEGSLRSAHWFAGHSPAVADADHRGAWITSHVHHAAALAADVDWTGVYQRPSRRLSWAVTVCCVALTVGLSIRPLPRLVRRTNGTAPIAQNVSLSGPEAPVALVPQVLEGIKAMRAGRPPSEEQLSAIGQALETARHDPAARKRIEAEVNGSDSKGPDNQHASSSDTDGAAWSDDYHNGFEMSDLDWAYQEAMARGRSEPAPHPEPGGDVTPPAGKSESASKGRQGEPASAGELSGSPVEGDTRGRPADFTSLLRGSQHSSGKAAAENQPQDAGRVARLAAALRSEVVHASTEITLPNLDRPAARRATNATKAPAAAADPTVQVRYDQSHATQPPAVPELRRPLLRGYFLRPAEPTTAVKRP